MLLTIVINVGDYRSPKPSSSVHEHAIIRALKNQEMLTVLMIAVLSYFAVLIVLCGLGAASGVLCDASLRLSSSSNRLE